MLIGAQTGTGNLKTADGVQNNPVRQGGQNQLMVDELHGDCYEAAYRGTLYSVANQAAVTTTAALATTFTGLSIANPSGSGVNLVVRRFMCAQFAVAAAAAIGVMAGLGASAGSLVPQNRLFNGPVSKAVASAGSTLGGTPILIDVYGSAGSLATTGYGLQQSINTELKGSLIIPPGAFAASFTSIATTSALLFEFVWEEVPV